MDYHIHIWTTPVQFNNIYATEPRNYMIAIQNKLCLIKYKIFVVTLLAIQLIDVYASQNISVLFARLSTHLVQKQFASR